MGSWIDCCTKDVKVRIGKAWSAFDTIWKFELSDGLKIGFFRAMVEMVLYGSTAWTLTQSLDKKLDGAYTKMLKGVKSVPWQQHIQMRCFM